MFLRIMLLSVLAFVAIPVWANPNTFGEESLLGVYLQELDDAVREKLQFEGDGVLVIGIVEASGAEKAGLKKGDIIVYFDQKAVSSIADLLDAIESTRPGDEVSVIVISKGKTKSIDVVMGSKKSHIEEIEKVPQQHKWLYVYEEDRPYLGVGLSDLTPQLAQFFKVKQGALITEVKKGSPAKKAGLKAGDIIIDCEGEGVHTSANLVEYLKGFEEGDEIAITVIRKGNEQEMIVTLGMMKGQKLEPQFKMPDFNIPAIPPALSMEKDMSEFRNHMKKYQKEMKAFRKELEELKKELKFLKKE